MHRAQVDQTVNCGHILVQESGCLWYGQHNTGRGAHHTPLLLSPALSLHKSPFSFDPDLRSTPHLASQWDYSYSDGQLSSKRLILSQTILPVGNPMNSDGTHYKAPMSVVLEVHMIYS